MAFLFAVVAAAVLAGASAQAPAPPPDVTNSQCLTAEQCLFRYNANGTFWEYNLRPACDPTVSASGLGSGSAFYPRQHD